jgi:hypothetical protein
MTAVQWLIQELRGDDGKGDFIFNGVINSELIEQAKEMEKQQIIDACKKGYGSTAIFRDKLSEQYYNEKFNK